MGNYHRHPQNKRQRTTFILAVGEVDPQSSGREEKTRGGTDICVSPRGAYRRLIAHSSSFSPPNDEDKWDTTTKNSRASRTSCQGAQLLMCLHCENNCGGFKWRRTGKVKYLFLLFLLFLMSGGGGGVRVQASCRPSPSSSPGCSHWSTSLCVSGLSTGRPILPDTETHAAWAHFTASTFKKFKWKCVDKRTNSAIFQHS